MNQAARAARRCGASALMLFAGAGFAAEDFSVAPTPLFLSPAVKPNLMVIFDNSQSMDATMGGKVISGDDDTTRGNIARGVLRGVITANRYAFNWGLTSFKTKFDSLYNTQAYFLGNPTTMVYTNDCVAGVSASNAGRRCVAAPPSGNGFNFLTYERSGDDPDINDVYYTNMPVLSYGIGQSSNSFKLWADRDNTTGWAAGNFSGATDTPNFTPTDAGFLPDGAAYKRGLFLNRGWGYYGDITGAGSIVEPVLVDTPQHFTNLQNLLAKEGNGNTAEIKNSAVFTPLTGSLQTVKRYFAQGESSAMKSPISAICQPNFVVLATDGNPTGRTNGTQYDPSEWINTKDATTNVWTFGQAQRDVFEQITALHTTTLIGANLSNLALANQTFDVKTYVIGMGETVANASSVAALDEMARLGGATTKAFSGASAAEIERAFQTIVGDVKNRFGAGATVAMNSGTWASGASLYQGRFNSTDWSGNLVAYPINADGTLSAASWEAAARVKAQNWDTGRTIITSKPSAALGQRGIKFRWPADPAAPTVAELDVDQITALKGSASSTADLLGAARLAYLRGDPFNEARNCLTPPCAAPQFRSRPATPLGDIIDSAPYYVGAPAFGYFDDFEALPYSTFVSNNKTRTPVIYVGANDGMLHAFSANNGDELFAYVPAALYPSLLQLSELSYGHRYYANGSPTVGDVFYGGAWHTLLVAGMRAGAKGVFALDVTDPTNFTEANAGNVVRWEFQDPDLGYVFGQPLIVKTNNGRWSVIISGGYDVDSPSGTAFLFVLDAETGALIRKIDTGAGTAASPNGLSSPAAIDSNGDGIVDLVYAGDLDGNLWKFDLLSATTTEWAVGNGALALFKTPGTQPITARPDVSRFPGGGYLVGFGTGRYLASGDPTTTSAQAIYAVRDPNNSTNATVALTDLLQQSILETASASGVEFRLSTHLVDAAGDSAIAGDGTVPRADYYATKKGWYINLPTSGERVVADARFRAGRLILVSMIPDVSTACSSGGSSWLLEFDAITGNRLDGTTFDTNNDGLMSVADNVPFISSGTGGSNNVSGRRVGTIASGPGFISVGKLDLRILSPAQDNDPTKQPRPITEEGSLGLTRDGRAMWREVR